jgi:hypothetical protein
MLCETCHWTERPGFVRRPAKPDPGLTAPRTKRPISSPARIAAGRPSPIAARVCASSRKRRTRRGRHRVAGSSPSKWPRCWSHASKASAGKLASAQMAKNHTQPVADAM